MYLFTITIIFLFSLLLFDFEKKSSIVKTIFLFIIIFLILQTGLRWNIGTDWNSYYRGFIYNYTSAKQELGYALLVSVVRAVTDNYSLFLIILALIQYIALANYIKNNSIYPLVSLCIAYAIYTPLLGMNRQFIALSIALFSIKFIFKRQFIPFLSLIFFASFFHKSSLFFLPAFFLWNIRMEKKNTFILLIGALFISYIGILNLLPFESIIPYLDEGSAFRLQKYINNADRNSILKGLLFRILIIVGCFYVKVPQEKQKTFNFFFLMYFVSVLMYVLFQSSALNIIAGRGALFYSISSIILVPYVIRYFSKDQIKTMCCWCVFFVLYAWILQKDLNNYISFVGKDIFTPYQCILFTGDLF